MSSKLHITLRASPAAATRSGGGSTGSPSFGMARRMDHSPAPSPVTMPRTALITGAAQRIGRRLALGLAEDGFAIAIHCNRSRSDAEILAAEIAGRGGTAIVLQADLGDASAVDQLVPQAVARLGPLGLLVNNASQFEPDEAADMSRAHYERQMAVNLTTPLFLAQAMVKALPVEHEGLIVNLIDQRVLKLTPQFFSYTLSKAALWTATRTMAQAFAPRIRVNAIAPGPTLKGSRQPDDDFLRQQQATILRRGPDLEDFSAALRFLVATRSLTGQMIALDGGQHLIWQTADNTGLVE
ncbi:SDR family oxidoreductase [Candidatus Raskinella chloraquaticus]